MNNSVQLLPLEESDREQFIADNQEAFNYGAMEEFGLRDNHFEEDGQIISRETIEQSIDSEPDYPWVKYPDYEVFRHTSNKKWFALIMEIPKDKLGLQTKDILSVVNFKCDPIMIGSFLNKEGYFPAYHLNKTSWISLK